MKTYEDLRKALKALTVTTIWDNLVLTGPKPGCSDTLMFELFGLEILRYASGAIKEAYLNGEEISNNRATRLQTVDLCSTWDSGVEEWEWKQRNYIDLGEGLEQYPLFKDLSVVDRSTLSTAVQAHQLDELYNHEAAERVA